MSAEAVVQAAALAALRAGLAGAVNGVFEGAAVEATPPYAELGTMLSADWGTKDAAGRELRLAVTVRDRAERPGRPMALAGEAAAAIAAMPTALDGWRVASLAFVRGRTVAERPGVWAASVEYRVRVLCSDQQG